MRVHGVSQRERYLLWRACQKGSKILVRHGGEEKICQFVRGDRKSVLRRCLSVVLSDHCRCLPIGIAMTVFLPSLPSFMVMQCFMFRVLNKAKFGCHKKHRKKLACFNPLVFSCLTPLRSKPARAGIKGLCYQTSLIHTHVALTGNRHFQYHRVML